MVDSDERREDNRYPLRAFAELGSSTQVWAAHVLDISVQGARVALLDNYTLIPGDTVSLKIEIPPEKNPEGIQVYLHLNGIIAHQYKHILGIFFQPDNDLDTELLNHLISTSQQNM